MTEKTKTLTTTVSEWMPLPAGFEPDEPLYIVTDSHGCTQAFDRLISHLPDDARFVFLGDAVDRGPDPVGLLERLLDLQQKRGALFLRGNHDSLAWFALKKDCPRLEWFHNIWFNNGGQRTEDEFTKSLERGLPQSELLTVGPKLFEDYWLTARNWYLKGNILLVHGGFPRNKGVEFLDMDTYEASSSERSPYWWRPDPYSTKEFETPRVIDGKEVFVICGHTPVDPKYSLQNYGILLDLGYEHKRAVELRGNRFRTIDTPCNERMQLSYSFF